MEEAIQVYHLFVKSFTLPSMAKAYITLTSLVIYINKIGSSFSNLAHSSSLHMSRRLMNAG